jgi:Reverse transcriptase (RNA-dependent DNA polymerase).
MMNDILGDLIRIRLVMVYLDDILIFGTCLKEHRQLVKEVLKRLRKNDLFAKAEKCFFEQSSIKYLGVIISENKVQMDEEKLAGVLEWPVPTKVKQVQAFLGFANFYRRFIEDFAKMSKPLTDLTKKDRTWTWGPEQQESFEALKKAFTTAPVLRIPNDEDPFKLSTDASDFATGAVLSQQDPVTTKWHPVAFFSKSLDIHERNYEIYDKELLAIIRGLEEYRHHLEGHPIKVEIWSDHQNLTFFRTAQKLTRRQARWALYLTRFDYVLYHKPGKTMQAEDPLSRRADHEMGIDLDNMNQVLLKPEFFAIRH